MRAKRICSSDAALERQLTDIRDNLKSRDYPDRQIGQGIARVGGIEVNIVKKQNQKRKERNTISSHVLQSFAKY